MTKQILYYLCITFVLVACKSTKVRNTNTNLGMSAKNVIKNHYAQGFKKETINARLKIKYVGKSSMPSVMASMRVKKDETIWISLSKLGFPIGKLLITPQRVSYYEKINRTYFEGDFTLLSNWLGTELDFKKVQNLLLGQAILDLKKDKFNLDVEQNKYRLKPKEESDLFNILFLINPDNFKINSQQISQKDQAKTLIINYKDYETIDNQIFPKEIHIAARDAKYLSTVDVNYRSIAFNGPVSFPFAIPKNYKRIELK